MTFRRVTYSGFNFGGSFNQVRNILLHFISHLQVDCAAIEHVTCLLTLFSGLRRGPKCIGICSESWVIKHVSDYIGYTVSDDRMSVNLEFWKDVEVVVIYFKALTQNFPGGTEDNYDKHNSIWPVSESRFEYGTSPIWSRTVDHLSATFNNEVNQDETKLTLFWARLEAVVV
jgi:hypothetical protein